LRGRSRQPHDSSRLASSRTQNPGIRHFGAAKARELISPDFSDEQILAQTFSLQLGVGVGAAGWMNDVSKQTFSVGPMFWN
jgi:hypothetical protein